MQKKYHIIVFGCQMNISDSERIASVLDRAKHKKTQNINETDLAVIVMCSVRQSAVDRVHGLAQKLHKLKAKNSKLQTVLTGCVLKKDKQKFSKIFDYVVDIKNIRNLPKIIKKTQSAKVDDRQLSQTSEYLNITPKYSSKFSANVPIMTGCNNFCSYCVVPHTREREVSRPAKKIISEIEKLIENGYKEIWLLGQNVNSYNDKKINFPELLKMADKIHGNFWIRFTSSHPKDFNKEVIKAMAECKKVTPYLNLPIQSGDNKILKSMNRRYTVKDYKNKIKELRKVIPRICLSTDVIVGFPGETKKQFENTAELFHDIKYDMAYINKYSSRDGTVASKLKDNVLPAEKKQREKVLTDILKQTALEHNKKLAGKETTVLIESEKNGFFIGKNEQYKTIKIQNKNSKLKIGGFAKVKITKAHEWALEGELSYE